MAKKKLSLIQSFRGFAAILVLLVHATTAWKWKMDNELFGDFFRFGFAGVDFFFVLSGFIITYIHFDDLGKPSKLNTFISKRFWRIYPVYWAVNLIIIPLYFIFPSARDYVVDPIVIIKSLLLLPQEQTPVLSVAWTLTHEILFYIIFSLTISLKKDNYRKIIISGWLSISLFIFLIKFFGIYLDKQNFLIFGFVFSSYNLEFALGCAVAYIIRKSPNYFKNYSKFIMVVGISGFLISGFFQSYNLLPIDNILAYGLFSGLIILGAALQDIYNPIKPQKLSILYYLGEASYSIYLTHNKILSVVVRIVSSIKNKMGIDGFAINFFLSLVMLVSTLIISCLFYSFVEKNLMKYINKNILKRA